MILVLDTYWAEKNNFQQSYSTGSEQHILLTGIYLDASTKEYGRRRIDFSSV